MQNVQYVTDTHGKPLFVQVPIEEYERLVTDSEELADTVAYREAKKNPGRLVPFDEAFAEVEAYHNRQVS